MKDEEKDKKKTKKDFCEKCGIFFWIDKHHVLPQATFGGKGAIAKLCPNCHRDYHEKLGAENLKNEDENFHYGFFMDWLEEDEKEQEL
jgi:hypothetical protein